MLGDEVFINVLGYGGRGKLRLVRVGDNECDEWRRMVMHDDGLCVGGETERYRKHFEISSVFACVRACVCMSRCEFGELLNLGE